MIKFLHISDTHYRLDEDYNRLANNMFARLHARFPNHYIIDTGDVANDALVKQFRNACRARMPFKNRIFLCPGNHDYGYFGNIYEEHVARRFDSMIMEPLGLAGRYYGDNEPVVNIIEADGDCVMLIGLDSNLETMDLLDFAAGEIGKRQLSVLGGLLSEYKNSDVIKIIYMHHHPFDIDPLMILKDAGDLCRAVWHRADVLLFGHKHAKGMWKRRWGLKYMLASEASPESGRMWEIAIDKGKVQVGEVFL